MNIKRRQTQLVEVMPRIGAIGLDVDAGAIIERFGNGDLGPAEDFLPLTGSGNRFVGDVEIGCFEFDSASEVAVHGVGEDSRGKVRPFAGRSGFAREVHILQRADGGGEVLQAGDFIQVVGGGDDLAAPLYTVGECAFL